MNRMFHIYGYTANVASCLTNINGIHSMGLISIDARISAYRSTQNSMNHIISCIYVFITTPETLAMLVINTRDKNWCCNDADEC